MHADDGFRFALVDFDQAMHDLLRAVFVHARRTQLVHARLPQYERRVAGELVHVTFEAVRVFLVTGVNF